eukprot:COSAG01_NODE_600_length_14996_cov_385.219434_4_plen_60_part_00
MLGGAGGCVAVLIFTLTYHLGGTWCRGGLVVLLSLYSVSDPNADRCLATRILILALLTR